MADILAFPNKLVRNFGPAKIAPTPVDQQAQPNAVPPIEPAMLQALAMCATAPKPALSELPDAAWVIGTGMRWINRRGRKRSSLPRLVSDLLEQHCDAGNHAAILFRDWIDCTPPEGIRDRDLATVARLQSSPAIHVIRHGGE